MLYEGGALAMPGASPQKMRESRPKLRIYFGAHSGLEPVRTVGVQGRAPLLNIYHVFDSARGRQELRALS